MPQVPNRYYNSPWIADAAKNLSLALVGDPEREAQRLQQRHIEAQMKRQADQDALAAEQRGKQVEANQSLSRIFEFGDEEVEAKRALAGNYINLVGADPTLFQALGTASPTYDTKAQLAQQGIDAKLAAQGRQIENLQLLEGIRSGDRRRGQDIELDIAQLNADQRAKASELLNRTRVHIQQIRGADNKPLDVTPSERESIAKQIAMYAYKMNFNLHPDLERELTSRTTSFYQKTRDASAAFDMALEDVLKRATTTPGERQGFLWQDRGPATLELDPNAAPAPAPASGGGKLSSAFGGQRMAPGAGVMLPTSAAPAAQPQAGGRLPVMNSPAEARAKLQPGDEFMTPDGRKMRVK